LKLHCLQKFAFAVSANHIAWVLVLIHQKYSQSLEILPFHFGVLMVMSEIEMMLWSIMHADGISFGFLVSRTKKGENCGQ